MHTRHIVMYLRIGMKSAVFGLKSIQSLNVCSISSKGIFEEVKRRPNGLVKTDSGKETHYFDVHFIMNENEIRFRKVKYKTGHTAGY